MRGARMCLEAVAAGATTDELWATLRAQAEAFFGSTPFEVVGDVEVHLAEVDEDMSGRIYSRMFEGRCLFVSCVSGAATTAPPT